MTMSFAAKAKFGLMKHAAAPAVAWARNRNRKPYTPKPDSPFGPPLKCAEQLKRIMFDHYFLARFAPGARPVAWVSSGAPVELLRNFGFYTVYPENHGALCGAKRMGPELCAEAEKIGYDRDLCSYARIDLGHLTSGKTPVGRLPRPEVLFCSNNICQTIMYWFKEVAHAYDIPLILFDAPYNYTDLNRIDLDYMVAQLKAMIPELECISGTAFDEAKFRANLARGKRASLLWGDCLETMTARPAPMTIFDAFVHLAPVVSMRGEQACLDYYELLKAELTDRVDQGVGAVKNERRRLLWDNIAVWYKLKDWAKLFAAKGCVFAAATYTNAWAETIHHLDENKPFESLARAYGLVILNNNLNHRLKLMADMIDRYRIDGLVIHSARSCKPYSIGQYDIKELLAKKLNLPAVIIEADIADYRAFSEEQAAARLEAFFESLD